MLLASNPIAATAVSRGVAIPHCRRPALVHQHHRQHQDAQQHQHRPAAFPALLAAASVARVARKRLATRVPSGSAMLLPGSRCARLASTSTSSSSSAEAAAGDVGASSPAGGLGRRLRERLADGIAEQEQQVDPVPTDEQKWIQQDEVDLNGIDPLSCVLGAIPVAALSYGFWIFTGTSAQYFVENQVETEFYPVYRLSIALQTVAVGLSSLAAGIFGVTALGLFLLGCRVLIGVASGELDPNKESTTPLRRSTAERVRDVLTKDPIDVAMEMRKQSKGNRSSGKPGGS